MIFWSIVFVVCLVLLIKCSDFFVDSSLIIGKSLGIPQHIIGITLVALGTSMPELASSVVSVLTDKSELVMATVVGSNTSNIFLVLGLTAVFVSKIDIKISEIKGVLPFLVLSAIWIIIGCFDGSFGRIDASIALILMVVFLGYCVRSGMIDDIEGEVDEDISISKHWLIFFASIVGISLSATYLIKSLEEISIILKIGGDIIALSALALGTSLPELAVTVNAARKGKQSVAVGNIVGSNIFNSLMIVGVPALMQPLAITETITHFSIPVMVVATMLFLFFIIDSKITFKEGIILVSGYLIFIGWLFFKGG